MNFVKYTTWWVTQATEIYFLTVTEARGLRSRCHLACFILSALSLSLTCKRPFSPFVFTWSFLYVCTCLCSKALFL